MSESMRRRTRRGRPQRASDVRRSSRSRPRARGWASGARDRSGAQDVRSRAVVQGARWASATGGLPVCWLRDAWCPRSWGSGYTPRVPSIVRCSRQPEAHPTRGKPSCSRSVLTDVDQRPDIDAHTRRSSHGIPAEDPTGAFAAPPRATCSAATRTSSRLRRDRRRCRVSRVCCDGTAEVQQISDSHGRAESRGTRDVFGVELMPCLAEAATAESVRPLVS